MGNIFYGNPAPTQGSVDPGFRGQIFDARYHGDATTPDGRYFLPEGLSVHSCDNACSLHFEVTSIQGAHSYSSELSIKAGVGFAGFGARFSASADFARIEKGAEEHHNLYTFAEAKCCSYRVFKNSFKAPPLTENFRAAVEGAPEEYDPDYYFRIIDEFGTHHLLDVTLGGLYGRESTFTNESWQRMISSSLSWAVSAGYDGLFSINASLANNNTREDAQAFNAFRSTFTEFSIGTKPPRSGDARDWVQETITNPMPYAMNLQNISFLFSSAICGNMSGLAAKKANIERALDEYCNKKLLTEMRIDSCDAPSPDPPLPEPYNICFGQTDALGGDSGVPFSDDMKIITSHGVATDLGVSEIFGASSSVVDSLELRLRKDHDRFMLGRHGGTGGNPDILAVPVNDQITQVAVHGGRRRSYGYIDSITFYTQKGQHATFGGEGAGGTVENLFDFVSIAPGNPKEAWLVGLYGRADQEYLLNIGFTFAYICNNSTPVPTPAPTPSGWTTPFTTSRGWYCTDLPENGQCGHHNEYPYAWCDTTNNDWDYCTKTCNVTSFGWACNDACDWHGNSYQWCDTPNGWDYCSCIPREDSTGVGASFALGPPMQDKTDALLQSTSRHTQLTTYI